MRSIEGTVVVEEEVTREEAAGMMQPPVSSRQLQIYLDLASLYLPEFANFRNEEGGLNRLRRLTKWHLPTLQKIRTAVRNEGVKAVQVKLARNPKEFVGC